MNKRILYCIRCACSRHACTTMRDGRWARRISPRCRHRDATTDMSRWYLLRILTCHWQIARPTPCCVEIRLAQMQYLLAASCSRYTFLHHTSKMTPTLLSSCFLRMPWSRIRAPRAPPALRHAARVTCVNCSNLAAAVRRARLNAVWATCVDLIMALKA
jgi:hypothetical protein